MDYPLLTVPILAEIDGSKLSLSIVGSLDEVKIEEATRIVVTPKEAKNFALQFLLPSGFAFEIPAIVPLLLDGGPGMPNAIGIAPTGPSTALLINTSEIPPGGEPQSYDIDFRVRVQIENDIEAENGLRIDFVVDPTVVNNPIGT